MLLVAALTGMAGFANAQPAGYGVDVDASFDAGAHEAGPIAALEEEINRLNRARAFEKTALKKEIDDLRIELRSLGQVKFRKISYRSTDGLMIPAYLFEPITPGQYPGIIDVHGGQHGTVTSRSLQRTINWVQSGYVILAPDYRGSNGYSESYYNKADYGGKEIDDMMAAVDYLESLSSVREGHIGIIGGSHGGYNALMAVIRYPDRFQVAVDLFGPTDLVYRLTATPGENANTKPADVEYFASMVGKTIDEAPELYEQRSPRYLADRIKVPLLILHGDKDQVVNVQESLWLIEALEKSGNTQFEYEIIKGANHGFPAALWQPGYERAKAFLDRYLSEG
jgi:dipeptidyl aminopeptidase/acylaminoacyl peptidase